MDGLTVFRIIEELKGQILGARVEKVRGADPSTLLLKLYSPARHPKNVWLVLSVEPRWPCVYLREHAPEENSAPTPFLQRARKLLRGARLRAVEQAGYDRIVRFSFERPIPVSPQPDEEEDISPTEEDASDVREIVLAAELFGRAANLFLLDAVGRVCERLRAHGTARGEIYTPPASTQRDPMTLDREDFQRFVSSARPLSACLLAEVEGFGPLYAAEVEARWRAMSPADGLTSDLAYAAFRSVLEDILHAPEPILYTREPLERLNPVHISPRDIRLSAIPLVHAEGWTATRLDSFSRATELYVTLVRQSERLRERRAALLRHLTAQIEKRERIVERLEADRRALGDAEVWRRWGEVLLANVSSAVRTAAGFLVTDYYDPEMRRVEIPTTAPTPQQAASEYFRLYRKATHGAKAIAARRAAIERELDALRRARERVEAADTLSALEDIARDIGVDRARPSSAAEKAEKSARARLPGILRFRSSEGFDILVGKSAEGNERLTFRLAAPHDVWLHAADYPGSHVIIRRAKGQTIPPRTLLQAAQLAAFFSQARQSKAVVVNYTERKFVSKIPRSRPGLVRVSEFRSLTVEPKVEAERVLEG